MVLALSLDMGPAWLHKPVLPQPLAGSWQDRVKAAKKAEKRAAKKAAKTAAGGADLAALSRGLPTGWQAMLDASTGDVYYGNLGTKVGAGTGWLAWQMVKLHSSTTLTSGSQCPRTEKEHLSFCARCAAVPSLYALRMT